MKVNPKKYHNIQKLFSRVKFNYVTIQIEIIIAIIFFSNILRMLKGVLNVRSFVMFGSRPRLHRQNQDGIIIKF